MSEQPSSDLPMTDPSTSPQLHQLLALVKAHPVVLFMKGNRRAPQCGFSAKVVDILDEYLDDYHTVDVLSDADVRENIKRLSDWPTLPQLYVRGQFQGGADIIKDMHKDGQLKAVLSASGQPVNIDVKVDHPEVFVTAGAKAAFFDFAGGPGPLMVRVEVDRNFDVSLDLTEDTGGLMRVVVDPDLTFVFDRASARRATRLTIDFVQGPQGAGFRIENASAPPRVKSISVRELKALRDSGKPHLLLDVRTDEERELANIEGSVLFGPGEQSVLDGVDPEMPLIFYCHHGVRSAQAAQHCLRLGFRHVSNVSGGIEAWSTEIDGSVPRY